MLHAFFANNIRTIRLLRGLSQSQLGRAAGLTMAYVSTLERGMQPSRPEHIEKIAAALSVRPDTLTDGDVRELLPRAGAR